MSTILASRDSAFAPMPISIPDFVDVPFARVRELVSESFSDGKKSQGGRLGAKETSFGAGPINALGLLLFLSRGPGETVVSSEMLGRLFCGPHTRPVEPDVKFSKWLSAAGMSGEKYSGCPIHCDVRGAGLRHRHTIVEVLPRHECRQAEPCPPEEGRARLFMPLMIAGSLVGLSGVELRVALSILGDLDQTASEGKQTFDAEGKNWLGLRLVRAGLFPFGYKPNSQERSCAVEIWLAAAVMLERQLDMCFRIDLPDEHGLSAQRTVAKLAKYPILFDSVDRSVVKVSAANGFFDRLRRSIKTSSGLVVLDGYDAEVDRLLRSWTGKPTRAPRLDMDALRGRVKSLLEDTGWTADKLARHSRVQLSSLQGGLLYRKSVRPIGAGRLNRWLDVHENAIRSGDDAFLADWPRPKERPSSPSTPEGLKKLLQGFMDRTKSSVRDIALGTSIGKAVLEAILRGELVSVDRVKDLPYWLQEREKRIIGVTAWKRRKAEKAKKK